MKHSFSLLQVANWLYIIKTQLRNLRLKLDEEQNLSKEQAIFLLKSQKNNLELIKDVINKKTRLLGVQPNFLNNLDKIKKDYGIEE